MHWAMCALLAIDGFDTQPGLGKCNVSILLFHKLLMKNTSQMRMHVLQYTTKPQDNTTKISHLISTTVWAGLRQKKTKQNKQTTDYFKCRVSPISCHKLNTHPETLIKLFIHSFIHSLVVHKCTANRGG